MRVKLRFLFIALVLSACAKPESETAAPAANTDPDTPADSYFRDCPSCPELLAIEPGAFTLGSSPAETAAAGVPEERAPNEQPPVNVTIGKGFAIGRYEVTIGEFREFATATGFTATPGCFGLNGGNWSMGPTATWDAPGYPVDDRFPAACLTADEYQLYLDWLSTRTGFTYRFPTEAEWEYVAQLGEGLPVRNWRSDNAEACSHFNAADKNFSDNFDGEWPAFSCDDGYPITSPVGNYAPNKLGMYDVLGNTAEATADCFFAGHTGHPTDGSARLTEPCGALVFKGGSWAAEPSFLRPAFRVLATRVVRGNGFGLRVVREL